jgi:hypothetical protein
MKSLSAERRRREKGGARYAPPFVSSGKMREIIKRISPKFNQIVKKAEKRLMFLGEVAIMWPRSIPDLNIG